MFPKREKVSPPCGILTPDRSPKETGRDAVFQFPLKTESTLGSPHGHSRPVLPMLSPVDPPAPGSGLRRKAAGEAEGSAAGAGGKVWMRKTVNGEYTQTPTSTDLSSTCENLVTLRSLVSKPRRSLVLGKFDPAPTSPSSSSSCPTPAMALGGLSVGSFPNDVSSHTMTPAMTTKPTLVCQVQTRTEVYFPSPAAPAHLHHGPADYVRYSHTNEMPPAMTESGDQVFNNLQRVSELEALGDMDMRELDQYLHPQSFHGSMAASSYVSPSAGDYPLPPPHDHAAIPPLVLADSVSSPYVMSSHDDGPPSQLRQEAMRCSMASVSSDEAGETYSPHDAASSTSSGSDVSAVWGTTPAAEQSHGMEEPYSYDMENSCMLAMAITESVCRFQA